MKSEVLNDGRGFDSNPGTLSGEASDQIVRDGSPHDKSLSRRVFEGRPLQQPDADPTYYGRPVVKRSPWSWSIPLYYYVGGASGGSAVLGAAATLLGGGRFPLLIVRTRWIAAVGSAVSGALLVYDLGRPSRFLNMLRVFRPTSPMNMGSWILAGFSSAAGFAALAQRGPAPLRTLADIASVKAGVFGLALSGYTGVLISQTAVPVWQRPHRTMPLLFLASAAASSASFLSFFALNPGERRTVAVFGAVGQAADIACGHIVEREIAGVPEAVKPLREGFSGFLWNAGKVLTAASLVLTLVPGSSKGRSRWIGALGTAGALCLRFGVHYAGQRSADNPRATFHQQRGGVVA